MAHLTSFKSAGAVGVLRHDERKETDKVQSRKNECIDNLKTHLNYNLAPPRKGTLMEHIKRVCEENSVKLNNRKDLNVMCSWVVTVPKVVQPQQYQLFFQRCYDFLKKRYGEKYTLSATVHMDETTPHLHYSFIPVGYDSKNDRLTVSSKLVATRTELRSCQQELSKSLDKEFGYDLGILNEATKEGNKTIQELKYKTATEKIEKAEKQLQNLQGKILTQKEVNAINGKKTLTGGLKGVSYKEYLSLKKTAQNVNKAKITVKKLKEEISKLENKNFQLVKEVYNAKEETMSKKEILKQNISKDIEQKIKNEYSTYYHYEVPTDMLEDIRHNVCCRTIEKENLSVVRIPFSEKDFFEKRYSKILEHQQKKENKNLIR